MLATPFETSGVVTSAATEATFYDAIATETGRITRWNIGTTTTGETIWLVCISGTTPPANPTPSNSLMVIAKQHGNEPASREVAIQVIRDLAYDTSPAMIAYLTEHPVYVIPTVNYRGIREGAGGVDLNRDHIILSQPETKAVHEAILAVRPVVSLDLHEFMGQTSPNVELAIGQYEELTQIIRARGEALMSAVSTHLGSAGVTSGPYEAAPSSPTTMTKIGAALHCVSLLIETMGNPPLANRVTYGVEAVRGARAYHEANLDDIVDDIVDSKAAAIATSRADPFTIDQSTVLYPVPQGYTISAANYATWAYVLTQHRITSVPAGSDRYVTMAQESRAVIPILMDPASLHKGFSAVPDNPPLPEPPVTIWGDTVGWGPIRVDGEDHEVSSVYLWSEESVKNIWPPDP